jgi:hypothetical protein
MVVIESFHGRRRGQRERLRERSHLRFEEMREREAQIKMGERERGERDEHFFLS